jgi:UDPglucose 6-dehydrogenase
VAAAAIRARLGPLIADGTLTLLEDAYAAAEGCHALVVVTEWQEFRTPNFLRLRSVLKTALIVDGRNIYDPSFVKRYGFVYHGVGLGVPV